MGLNVRIWNLIRLFEPRRNLNLRIRGLHYIGNSKLFIVLVEGLCYLEYHCVCPFVRIGSPPPPLPQANVYLPPPPPGTKWGEGGISRLRTTGEKAWHSVYSVIVLNVQSAYRQILRPDPL